MPDINKFAARSGRMIKEDGSIVNLADLWVGFTMGGGTLTPILDETLIVTAAASIGIANAPEYIQAIVTIDDNSIRFFASGKEPTFGEGHLLSPGAMITLNGQSEITKFRAIAQSDPAKLQVSYYTNSIQTPPQQPPINPSDTTPPSTPTGVTVVSAVNGAVNLSWDANSDPDLLGYNVYFDGVKVNASVITSTIYQRTGLTNHQTYSVQVSAVDTSLNESQKTSAFSAKPVFLDDFNRSDSTNVGAPWLEIAGDWEVKNNALELQAISTTSANEVALFDGGSGNGILKARFLTNIAQMRLNFRMWVGSGTASGYSLINRDGRYRLFSTASGGTNELGTLVKAVTPQAGDIVEVRLDGTSIACYVNGEHILNHTSDYNMTYAHHGVGSYRAIGIRYDDVTWERL